MIFNAFWSVAKLLLDEKTKNKFLILNDNYEKTLLEMIDDDKLADFLGGTLKNPMEDKLAMQNPPWRDYEDHIRNEKNFFINGNNVSDPWEAAKGMDHLAEQFFNSISMLI